MSITRDPKRSFSNSQRIAIFQFSDGKCQKCQQSIIDTAWHPDHIVPWHAGGRTDVVNGQALCVKCNLTKGGKIESHHRFNHR